MAQAVLSGNDFALAVADMICLAFFFLLRPGEYTGVASESQPFLLRDVRLTLGNLTLNLDTATAAQLLGASPGLLLRSSDLAPTAHPAP